MEDFYKKPQENIFDAEKIKDIDNSLKFLSSKNISLFKLWEINENGDSQLIEYFEELYKIFQNIINQCDSLVDENNWKPLPNKPKVVKND